LNPSAGFEYLKRSVKLEFGSLTDQQPVGRHPVRPWVAEEFMVAFPDWKCEAIALDVETTFWEKCRSFILSFIVLPTSRPQGGFPDITLMRRRWPRTPWGGARWTSVSFAAGWWNGKLDSLTVHGPITGMRNPVHSGWFRPTNGCGRLGEIIKPCETCILMNLPALAKSSMYWRIWRDESTNRNIVD